jgi:hypothetical protein
LFAGYLLHPAFCKGWQGAQPAFASSNDQQSIIDSKQSKDDKKTVEKSDEKKKNDNDDSNVSEFFKQRRHPITNQLEGILFDKKRLAQTTRASTELEVILIVVVFF